MKVVLKQDVKSIGKKDEMHEVSDGYARNFLFPRKLAVPADASAVNEVRNERRRHRISCRAAAAAAKTLAEKLNGKTITITAKAEAGRTLVRLRHKDIAAELTKLAGEEVDKRKVALKSDIKTFGSYEVEVKVYPKVAAKVTVSVKE